MVGALSTTLTKLLLSIHALGIRVLQTIGFVGYLLIPIIVIFELMMWILMDSEAILQSSAFISS